MVKLFANLFWLHLPGSFQKYISLCFSCLFEIKISRFFIVPYCAFFGLDADYLDQFIPDHTRGKYRSYSDFFQRKLKQPLLAQSEMIWPCEGYVCDWGNFSTKSQSTIKGQTMNLNSVFHSNSEYTKSHYFVNIFLHNHNYHRIHAPVSGVIKNIQRIPGDLVFLRPWFYRRSDVSYPSIRNERVSIEIMDVHGLSWFLSLVGGFGVGTIETNPNVLIGSHVSVGQELGLFKLGSTVCMASPYDLQPNTYLEQVRVGDGLKLGGEQCQKLPKQYQNKLNMQASQPSTPELHSS
jgi:phosphatidylserine decarboxylase